MRGAETSRMADSRSELMAVLQRVVDLLVKLIGGKIELATTQLQDGAVRTGRAAGYGVAGGLILTVGLALLAAAAVDALAPLIAYRPLRLLIVAAPFVTLGAATIATARRALQRRVAGPSANEPDGQRDEGKHQEHMNPRAHGVPTDHAEQPQHQQQRGNHPQHGSHLLQVETASAVPGQKR
jgi:hypothetical protein